jgi:DNA-binding transcriptional ArsR family regulator
MNVEDILSSKVRIKIVKILAQVGGLNASEIARRLEVDYNTVHNHLKALEDESILQHKTFGRIRLYRLNEHSVKAKALQTFIDAWKEADKQ